MFDVQIALEGIAEARAKWDMAFRKFNADVEYLMARLLNEAAVNHMSVEQVAKASGLPAKRVRALMRDHGLNPKQGKRLLANHAATALTENAALLGIEPHEMDLTSPLAYLPMGSDLRRILETEAGKGVKEEDPTPAIAAIIAEEAGCGHCDGSCGSCWPAAERIVALVRGTL
jgi:hypothetical protein